MSKIIKLFVTLAFILAHISFVSSTNAQPIEDTSYTPAILSPAPTATFKSPSNNLSTAETKLDITFDLKSSNSELLNQNVYVSLFIGNSSSLTNKDINYEIINQDKVVTFTSKTQSKTLSFTDVPILFSGNNYIYCVVETASAKDFCGGLYNPNILTIKYTGTKEPLYRFYSQEYSGHFYTTNATEKKAVVNNYPDYTWTYEGIGYYVTKLTSKKNCTEADKSKVYRFWNPTAKHHFYTANAKEKDVVVSNNPNFVYEGETFCASTKKLNGSVPVYRFYNLSQATHFYTANEKEKDVLMKTDINWNFEGIAYYAFN